MLSWSFDVLHIIFSVGMRTPLGYSWFRLTRILCYFFALPVIVLHLYSCLAYTSVRFQRERSGDETARPRCVPAIGVRALRPVHLVANLVAVAGGARSKHLGACLFVCSTSVRRFCKAATGSIFEVFLMSMPSGEASGVRHGSQPELRDLLRAGQDIHV